MVPAEREYKGDDNIRSTLFFFGGVETKCEYTWYRKKSPVFHHDAMANSIEHLR
jgi:extradiol dioxygenase family protein